MTFHKEGYPSLFITIFFIIVMNGCVYFFLKNHLWIKVSGLLLSFLFLFIILQFFRNPKRTFILNEQAILAPADGKVVAIEEVEENEYFKEKKLQVSIFMSPFNIHINRYPIGGRISYFKYHPGKYLVAWHPKSSTKNERTTIVVTDRQNRSVLYRQIAGVLARRIVFYGKTGDQVVQCEECGFIKFGSRVDLFLPLDIKLNVRLGEKVKGGLSTIAFFEKE